MAVVTGTNGASATPATDLYNIIATALAGNANWTQSGITNASMNAADSGTTAATQTWKNTGGVATFFVNFEIDDTNARLRIRSAEDFDGYSAAGAKKIRQPAGSGGATTSVADSTSITPTANYSVTDSDITWGSSNPGVHPVDIATAAGGYTYIYEVRNHLLIVASNSGGNNWGCAVGEFTSLVTSTSDPHPLMTAAFASAAKTGGLYYTPTESASAHAPQTCVSRSPLRTTAEAGAFCYQWGPLIVPGVAPSSSIVGAGNQVARYFTNGLWTSPAVLWGKASGVLSSSSAQARHFRGYLANSLAIFAAGTLPNVGDTLTVGGSTYYFLGPQPLPGGTTSATSASGSPLIYVKG